MRVHWRWATLILLAVPATGLLLGFTCSPLMQIRKVVVKGPDASLSHEVVRKVKVPPGTSILFYPLHRLRAQVRDCHRLERMSIRRASPTTLEIQVFPYQPFAALDDGVGCTLVSRGGKLLQRAARPPEGLPVLAGLTIPRAPLGKKIESERWAWVQEVLAGATKGGIREGLWVDFLQLHDIRVRLPEGLGGSLGNVNHLGRKMTILGRVRDQLRREGVVVSAIDVSTPDKPRWTRR